MGRDRVVDDNVHERDVESSRGNVRRHQDGPPTGLELVERSETRRLAELTMKGDGRETEHAEHDGQFLGVMDGRGEDDDGVCGEFVAEVDEVGVFLGEGAENVVLEEGGDGRVSGSDAEKGRNVRKTGGKRTM